jgi:hypothetical protein
MMADEQYMISRDDGRDDTDMMGRTMKEDGR